MGVCCLLLHVLAAQKAIGISELPGHPDLIEKSNFDDFAKTMRNQTRATFFFLAAGAAAMVTAFENEIGRAGAGAGFDGDGRSRAFLPNFDAATSFCGEKFTSSPSSV